jgi:hypothetical protein
VQGVVLRQDHFEELLTRNSFLSSCVGLYLFHEGEFDGVYQFIKLDEDPFLAVEHQRAFNAELKSAAALVVGEGVVVHVGDEFEYLEGEVGADGWGGEAGVEVLAEEFLGVVELVVEGLVVLVVVVDFLFEVVVAADYQ